MRVALARAAWLGLALLSSLCLWAPPADADYQLAPGQLSLEVLDRFGNSDLRAGSHPYRLIAIVKNPERLDGSIEKFADMVIGFPTGLAGDPSSAPFCSRAAFDAREELHCPAQTQVGNLISASSEGLSVTPVFNVEPAPGETASFGVEARDARFKFVGHLRADFRLTARVDSLPGENINELAQPFETRFEFWGVPADHQEGTSTPRGAFLTLPTRCGEPLQMEVRVRTWERRGEWGSGTASTAQPLSGCQNLLFRPSVALQLASPQADTPTGLDMDLRFQENADVDGLADSQARRSSIEFPPGMGISFGAATHLLSCSDAELAAGSEEEPAKCPAASRVGSVEINAPALSEPMTGRVYLGQESPDARFRLFIVAKNDEIEAKVIGEMRPDPPTGRLTAVLDDLPQLPLSNLRMSFDGGSKALLTTPLECGPAKVEATVTPYSGTAPVTTTASADVGARPGQRCGAPPYEPTLTTALSAERGGQATSFATVISRREGEQATDRFAIDFPPGLNAGLGAVGTCSEAAIAAASCPAASKIGDSFIDVGSGPETAELTGGAYLTGPYRGGPFGVVQILRAKVGPFDFGTITVRAAMKIDPLSGQVSVESDPLPQTFEGFPIRFQRLGLIIDRPGMLTSPTSCTAKTVASTMRSAGGAVAHPSDQFSLRGCVGLPFKPSFAVTLTDPKELHKGGNPGMEITTRSRPGEANMHASKLLLPPQLGFTSANLSVICPRRAAFEGKCPKGSQIGTGVSKTPILSAPLRGPLFVVQPRRAGSEPDLWAHLQGEGFELNLRSESVLEHGQVLNSFADMPDVPLSRFTMKIDGGKNGLISLRRGLCAKGKAAKLKAPASFEGQNGAVRRTRIPISAPKSCHADQRLLRRRPELAQLATASLLIVERPDRPSYLLRARRRGE